MEIASEDLRPDFLRVKGKIKLFMFVRLPGLDHGLVH